MQGGLYGAIGGGEGEEGLQWGGSRVVGGDGLGWKCLDIMGIVTMSWREEVIVRLFFFSSAMVCSVCCFRQLPYIDCGRFCVKHWIEGIVALLLIAVRAHPW